jgi:RNA polymerase sigma factor (sigma-70 family)
MGINNLTECILSDEEIIGRIVAGEKYLYEKLIRRFNTRLYRICMSIVNDDAEAEDVMQSAYINAYLHLSGFRGTSSFATWLTRILINESILHKKKKMKRLQLAADELPQHTHSETPLKTMINKELKGLLEQAVANLPEKYRMVFVMREVQELSTSETMELLEIGESNVKIRLARAKEMLRAELKPYCQFNEIYDFHLIRCDRIVNYVFDELQISRQI